MRIQIVQTSPHEWRADPVDLPGAPPVGVGRNSFEAVGSLFFALQHETEWVNFGWPAIEIDCEKKG